MTTFIASFIFVLLAEMGDKTQLLALAFATKYNPFKVLFAILIATLLNHGIAVILGHYLAKVLPMDIMAVGASLLFILFGLWTIKGDELDEKNKKETKFGPVLTVAIAFFLAEIGDKTQFATITLAAKYSNMGFVLLGTTLGMMIADGAGIVIGLIMKKHIPEKFIKWFAAVVFILFGLHGIYEYMSDRFSLNVIVSALAGLIILTALLALLITGRKQTSK